MAHIKILKKQQNSPVRQYTEPNTPKGKKPGEKGFPDITVDLELQPPKLKF